VNERREPDARPRRGIGAYVAVAVAIVAAMSMVAAVGFRSALSGWSFVTAAAIGTAGASAVVLFARARRLLLGESVALSAAAFIVFGGVAVGGFPTPGAYADFARGLVDGWADLLSAAPPADITVELRALPFTVAWLAAAIGGEIARHTRRPGLPAIGPILALALSLLFTVEERWLALLQGAGIVAGTLALITAAQRLGRRSVAGRVPDEFDAGAVSTNRRRLTFGAIVVVGAVVAAPLLGPHLPLAEARDRFDLRRYQVPPFDPLAVPSPLVQLKSSLKDERRDDVVFTVAGDTEVDRWPVAVLTDYDGVVWTVADPDRHAAATEFVPVDTQLPQLDDPPPDDAKTVEHTVTIHDLGGFFLPTAGSPLRLTFADDPDPRMNLGTGTVALPGGLPDDFTYQVTSAVAPDPSEAELEAAKITPVDRSDELELLPPPVRNLAADLVEGKDIGWAQMAAIRDKFVNEGFYDVTPETPPGHSYARISEMLGDPTRIVGYEEQYAAAAAVMARVASLPARVVVGYRIPADAWHNGRADVTAGDISAWVELNAGELGWVPVDVSPDRSRTPDPEAQGSTTKEIAVPNPPPPPPPPPEVPPPRQEDDEVEKDEAFQPIDHEFARSEGISIGTWIAIGGGGIPLFLLVAFVTTVIGWKALRRRRRRLHGSAGGRVAGAWAETVDRCTERGMARPVGTTPQEAVGMYLTTTELGGLEVVGSELRRLATEVDRAAYAADPPDQTHVERAWASSDRVVDELRRNRNVAQRMRMRLDPRPLLRNEAKPSKAGRS
jgi:transglutaminase-like putative cysteine protease